MSNWPLSKATRHDAVDDRDGDYYVGFLIDPKGTKIRPVTDRANLNFAVSETLDEARATGWDWQILLCRDVAEESHPSPVYLLQNETRDSALDALKNGGVEVVASWNSENGSLPIDSH